MTLWEGKLPTALDGVGGICFDSYGTLFEITDKRRPYRTLIEALAEERRAEFRHRIMREDCETADWPAALGVEIKPETMAWCEAGIAAEGSSVRYRPLMKPIIENLRRHGIRTMICSNAATPYYQPVMDELPHDFGLVLMSFHVGLLKPEAAIYELVTTGLGLSRETLLFVGDTWDADIEGPRRAGMKSMHVDAFTELFRTPEVKRRQAACLATPYGCIEGACVLGGIVIDPVYPPPMTDPHRRNRTEHLLWKDRPYILTGDEGYEVWCLGRATPFGPRRWDTLPDIEGAVDLALSPTPEPPPENPVDPDDPELAF